MVTDCACARADGASFPATLKVEEEGTGLSLYCDACGGWLEDSWLITAGIPVQATAATSRDYSGEVAVTYFLAEVTAVTRPGNI